MMKESNSGGGIRAGGRTGRTVVAAAAAAGASVRRERGRKASGNHSPLRRVALWIPLVGKILFVICAAVLVIAGYRVIASAAFFRADSIDVAGAERASAERIGGIVRRRAAANNVWKIDLNELSSELEKEPWVRRAVVSRVLPSGLRVRITEREPRVVVRTSNGQLMWADEDAVLLARVAPTDDLPPFFLRGYDETLTAAAQTENRRRIAEAIRMIEEWRQLGIVDRISEVNVEDLRDVRAQLAGRDAAIEVRLGAGNYGARLEKALKVLDEERDAPGGRRGTHIVRIYATNNDRITVGVGNGANMEPVAPLDAVDTNVAREERVISNLAATSGAVGAVTAAEAKGKRSDGARSGEPPRAAKAATREKRSPPLAADERRADKRRLADEKERANESARAKANREAAKPKTTALAQRPRRTG